MLFVLIDDFNDFFELISCLLFLSLILCWSGLVNFLDLFRFRFLYLSINFFSKDGGLSLMTSFQHHITIFVFLVII